MSQLMKKAIKEAFFNLLEKNDYSDITIKHITDECDISRSSFYYHYNGLQEVLEEILKDEIERIIKMHPDLSSFEECINAAVEMAFSHRKACLHIYHSINQQMYERYLMKMCEYTVKVYGDSVLKEQELNEKDKELVMHFMKCEVFGQVIDWLEHGSPVDFKKRVKRFCELSDGMVKLMIKNSNK